MAAIEKSIVVNCPPEKIWNMVRDPAGWYTWFEGAAQPKSISGDGSVGTVVETGLTVANIPLPARIKVVEAVPNTRWKGEFTGPATEGYQLWTDERGDSGTRLTFRIEENLSGPAKLAEGIVLKSFDQMADKTLANVKALVEG